MEDAKFNFPMMGMKYVLRSTNEEVELIDGEIKARGERNDEDWVTYIDSKGVEHIKEHLNVQFDFKPISNDVWKTFMDMAKPRYPNARNNRIFDMAKELIIKFQCDTDEAIIKATEFVDKVGIEFD